MIRAIVLSAVMAVSILGCAWSMQPAEEQFFEANKHYVDGHYHEAAMGYEAMLQTGYRNTAVYYNLGNSYFKQGLKGKAVLNYLRAKRLKPEDGDIFANLNYTMSLLDEFQIKDEQAWHQKALTNMAVIFAPGFWYTLAALIFWSLCVLVGYWLLKVEKFTGQYLVFVLFILWLICLLLHFVSKDVNSLSETAIVITPEIEVRYSPSHSGAVAFKLAEGIPVRQIRSENNWTQIHLTKSKSGWVPQDSIELI